MDGEIAGFIGVEECESTRPAPPHVSAACSLVQASSQPPTHQPQQAQAVAGREGRQHGARPGVAAARPALPGRSQQRPVQPHAVVLVRAGPAGGRAGCREPGAPFYHPWLGARGGTV